MSTWDHPTCDESSATWDDAQLLIAQHYAAMALPSSHRQCVVQAGGNIGIFPYAYGIYFQHVVTFEPEAENRRSMEKNLGLFLTPAERRKVEIYHCALGARAEALPLKPARLNRAAARLSQFGDGDLVPVRPLDDIELRQCNLIQFDVEGWELQALLGATRTIVTHRPVVIVEMCHVEQKLIRAFFEGLNYSSGYEVSRLDLAYDEVFYPKEWKLPRMAAEANSARRAAKKRRTPSLRLWPRD